MTVGWMLTLRLLGRHSGSALFYARMAGVSASMLPMTVQESVLTFTVSGAAGLSSEQIVGLMTSATVNTSRSDNH